MYPRGTQRISTPSGLYPQRKNRIQALPHQRQRRSAPAEQRQRRQRSSSSGSAGHFAVGATSLSHSDQALKALALPLDHAAFAPAAAERAAFRWLRCPPSACGSSSSAATRGQRLGQAPPHVERFWTRTQAIGQSAPPSQRAEPRAVQAPASACQSLGETCSCLTAPSPQEDAAVARSNYANLF